MYWNCIPLAVLFFTLHLTSGEESTDKLTVERANKFILEHETSVNPTYRLKYHFAAPYGWINDPNGFIFFRGEYHLFYQYNPYDSVPNEIHWGHAKSKDLIHWENLPVALAPDQPYDAEGVFSGSSIEKDGKLYLMYTGNANHRQTQCIAVSEDGIHFEKVPQNPVLDSKSLPSNAQLEDFRDPKVFKRGNLYYVVTVSKTLNNTGQVLLFESKDLIDWKFKSILLEGNSEEGIMWECPDVYELNGKDVLVLSPIEFPKRGEDYTNYDSVVEFIGKIDWKTGKMTVETMKELDHGQDFYATQSLKDNRGRRIVIAWMAMWGRNFPTSTLGHGWAGAMTLPREIRVRQRTLIQKPIAEIEKYYKHPVELRHVTLNNEVKEFDKLSGDVAMLELDVHLKDADSFWIDLRASKDEKTVLSYDKATHELKLDRGLSGYEIEGYEPKPYVYRTVKVPLHLNNLKLQVFLDTSSVEIFVNDGVETMTDTIYPKNANSTGIRFGVRGKAIIQKLKFAHIQL